MLLCVNHGVFYEFIPSDEFFNENPSRVSLGGVELGINYVIVLNTNAGLWGYNIGDTIRFVNLDPYRIIVTGRISFLPLLVNTYLEEVERSLKLTLEEFPLE